MRDLLCFAKTQGQKLCVLDDSTFPSSPQKRAKGVDLKVNGELQLQPLAKTAAYRGQTTRWSCEPAKVPYKMSTISRPQLQTRRFSAQVPRKCAAHILWGISVMEKTIHGHGTCSGPDL